MPEISGRIMYVNMAKPGQRSGSLKLDSGDYIGVPDNMLYQFQRGQEVTLEYKDRQSSNGKWYKDIVPTQQERAYPPQVSRPAAPRPPAPPARAPAPPRPPMAGPRQTHGYNTGKQICVTGITQRFVQAGTTRATDIPAVMRLIAETYDDIFNPQPKPVYQPVGQPAGPREEIPPFDDQVDDIGYDQDDPNRAPF